MEDKTDRKTSVSLKIIHVIKNENQNLIYTRLCFILVIIIHKSKIQLIKKLKPDLQNGKQMNIKYFLIRRRSLFFTLFLLYFTA